ncbi:hypothetical protein PO909_017714 [Leuciscus waleckii]
MCGLYKSTFILTLISVTICLIILWFTEGFPVWSVERHTNETETTVLNSTIRRRDRREASVFKEVIPVKGLQGSTVTIEEGSNITFKCNPFETNCQGCDGHAEQYVPFYFCKSPCDWGNVKAYAFNIKEGYDRRFRVFPEDRLSNNRYGMRVELENAACSDQGPPQIVRASGEELAWMKDGETKKGQINPEVKKAMMKCQGNKACALALLQKEELQIKTSCWMCLEMSHAWKAVPLGAATVNETKCLIPQQMTDVLKTVVELERGKTPTEQPADKCPFNKPSESSPAAVWVCGDRAYHRLPRKDWSGCCYPALMNVGTSVYLPSKVGKREKRDVKILPEALPNSYAGYTLTDPWTTPGANIGWSIFLGVGTTVAINKINGLAWTVLAIANSTENAFTLINDEMKQVREALVQNRLVLDMVTAERGGVCKMLGVSCCFNIPDYSDNITNIIEHMRKAVKEPPKATDSEWVGWLMSAWSGWFYRIIQTVLPIVGMGLLILFCLPCIMKCLSSLVQRLIRAGTVSTSVQAVKLTLYPITDGEQCDDYDSDDVCVDMS